VPFQSPESRYFELIISISQECFAIQPLNFEYPQGSKYFPPSWHSHVCSISWTIILVLNCSCWFVIFIVHFMNVFKPPHPQPHRHVLHTKSFRPYSLSRPISLLHELTAPSTIFRISCVTKAPFEEILLRISPALGYLVLEKSFTTKISSHRARYVQ
jgi:hypothetical protein